MTVMLQKFKRWWQIRTGELDTPLDYDAPFWVFSLFFHIVLLVVLARVLVPPPADRELRLAAATEESVPLEDELPPLQSNIVITPTVGMDSPDLLELAADISTMPETEIEHEIESLMPEVDLGQVMTHLEFDRATANRVSSMPVKGSVGQSLASANGAVDRITQEILLSLDERKTLVVWLFDQSPSMIRQRQQIAERFERVYRELTVLAAAGNASFAKHSDQPLLSTIYAFGQNFVRVLPEPTDDVAVLQEAVANVGLDSSGIENVFSAVIQAAVDFQKFSKVNRATGERPRNVMIIVVSDEAGDDQNRLDECVALCVRLEVPVYVIGVPAPFGREETQVRWVDPDPRFDQTPQWAVVNQGPESLLPERLKLDFVGGNFQDLEMIDSGFGPFALTRLCYETGGIYFAVHSSRDLGRQVRASDIDDYSSYLRHFFDPQIMKRYRPDLVSQQTYMQRLAASKARQSLVQAAQVSRVGALETPITVFPKLDEAVFVNLVNRAQRSAALLEPKLDQLYNILRQGESDRATESSPRWQAGYDLAYGRVLANKVRAEAYNAMLAMIKSKLQFQNERNNTWVLQPADTITTGSQAVAMADKARVHLQRVVDEHPGTPWAMLAERELATPLGWAWVERYTPPPPQPNMQNNNNNNAVPNVPQPQPLAQPLPSRPPPRI